MVAAPEATGLDILSVTSVINQHGGFPETAYRATKRKGNKMKQDQAKLAAAATKNALCVVGDSKAGSQQRGEAKEANGDPHSEVVARPTLTQITFHSLSLIKLPMRPKHGGTFILT